jgi:hypothetical protein
MKTVSKTEVITIGAWGKGSYGASPTFFTRLPIMRKIEEADAARAGKFSRK